MRAIITLLRQMTLAPDIFREIERLARRRGWSQAELARQLGVDRTLLAHLRAGRRVPTSRFLARTARAFSEESSLKESLWLYFRDEMPVDAEAPVLPVGLCQAAALSIEARRSLRLFVRTFPHHLIDGRGLIIRSSDERTLSSAATFIAEALRASGVSVAQRLAHRPVLPSEVPVLARVRLLVVERAEYANAAVRDIIAERLNMERPVVLTAAADLADRLDADLIRVLRLRCQELRISHPEADG
ncbi:MAG: helix-turn-helix domain-containing protein [Thermoanaerobaculaceae bacterium]|nr:helix-turn-helix domain-containing protein [Thermoanaerobaculaceae bacterium]